MFWLGLAPPCRAIACFVPVSFAYSDFQQIPNVFLPGQYRHLLDAVLIFISSCQYGFSGLFQLVGRYHVCLQLAVSFGLLHVPTLSVVSVSLRARRGAVVAVVWRSNSPRPSAELSGGETVHIPYAGCKQRSSGILVLDVLPRPLAGDSIEAVDS